MSARSAAPPRARSAAPGALARLRAAVRRIPRGRVATYGQVAAAAGLPGRARLAGHALATAIGDALPWHRVVNAAGRLSVGRADPAAALTQRLRLEREGVTFDARGRVRLARHRWEARGTAPPRPRRGGMATDLRAGAGGVTWRRGAAGAGRRSRGGTR